MMRSRWSRSLAALTAFFAVACVGTYIAVIGPMFQGVTLNPMLTDFGDAVQYNALAISLSERGEYAVQPGTPFFEREPGYPLFMAAVYSVFGTDNYTAVFVVQALIHLCAVLAFTAMIRRRFNERTALIAAAFLLLLAPILHITFSLLRESLSLSLMMLFFVGIDRTFERRSWVAAIGAGLCLGFAILTFVPFLLLPPALVPLWLYERKPWKQAVLILAVSIACVVPWAARNYAHKGELCLTGCYRGALQWYVRGERSEKLRGIEPLKCLWAEYVSRDWSGRSDVCSFNGTWHRQWPEGFKGVPEDRAIEQAGQAKVLDHFGWYLWDSLFEIIELHIPYVNGWGRTYNIFAVLSTALLYLGCALGMLALFSRRFLPYLWVMAYITGLFILTDATPRYLMPALFGYALLAGIGYDRALSKISHAIRQRRHSGL